MLAGSRDWEGVNAWCHMQRSHGSQIGVSIDPVVVDDHHGPNTSFQICSLMGACDTLFASPIHHPCSYPTACNSYRGHLFLLNNK